MLYTKIVSRMHWQSAKRTFEDAEASAKLGSWTCNVLVASIEIAVWALPRASHFAFALFALPLSGHCVFPSYSPDASPTFYLIVQDPWLRMSSLRNSLHRRNHKERGQLAHRSKLGILEKHKDYVLRARDYHSKQDRLTRLRQKAAERNKDEFYFSMTKQRTKVCSL